MQIDLNETKEVRDAARKAKHAAAVARFNEEARRFPAARFHVIEKATGKSLGDGSPMPIGFATEICNQRDIFRTGEFFIKAANDQGAALLAWRAA